MKGHRLPSAALAATATIAAAVLTSATAPASPAATTPAQVPSLTASGTAPFASPPAGSRPDIVAATAQLAKDEHLQPGEAARRIGRQDTQLTAADTLKSRLGSGFGGAWIDHELLTAEQQEVLLAVYGVLTRRDSVEKGRMFRRKPDDLANV